MPTGTITLREIHIENQHQLQLEIEDLQEHIFICIQLLRPRMEINVSNIVSNHSCMSVEF